MAHLILTIFSLSFTFLIFCQKEDTPLLSITKSYNENNVLVYTSSFKYDSRNNLISETNKDLIFKTGNVYLARYDSENTKKNELFYLVDSIEEFMTDSIIYNQYEIVHYSFLKNNTEISIKTTKLDSNNRSIFENKKTINALSNSFINEVIIENEERRIINEFVSEYIDSIFRDSNGNEILRKKYDAQGIVHTSYSDGRFITKKNTPNTLLSVIYSYWMNGNKIHSKTENSTSKVESEDFYFYDELNNLTEKTEKKYLSNLTYESSVYFSYKENKGIITEKSWDNFSQSYQIRIYPKNKPNQLLANSSYSSKNIPISKTLYFYKDGLLMEAIDYNAETMSSNFVEIKPFMLAGKTEYVYSK